jgi:hypothetical protein
MVPKSVFAAVLIGAALLVGNGPSVAQGDNPGQYKPDEFLSLDLSKAVLSPKRLGPETQFAPVAVEASSGTPAAQASVAPKAVPHVALRKTRAAEVRPAKTHEERARNEKPRGEARTRLARRHSNPLDAQAFDTRIQVWPCRSGGICNWQRQ